MGCSMASALTCFASGGSSEGKLKLRSMRSCAPEWRWIFMRIAAVGTLKSVAPMLIGNRAGALDPSGPQVGHSKKVTSTIAPTPSAHPTMTGARWLLEGRREPRRRCWAVEKRVVITEIASRVRAGGESRFEYATHDRISA